LAQEESNFTSAHGYWAGTVMLRIRGVSRLNIHLYLVFDGTEILATSREDVARIAQYIEREEEGKFNLRSPGSWQSVRVHGANFISLF
jgi:hypothetical protein